MDSFGLESILLGIGSIVLTAIFVVLVKKVAKKFKRPNGKKRGILSLHVSIAFAIVTVVALLTKNVLVTGLTLLLAYLIVHNHYSEGQNYLYQIVFSGIFGVAIPYGLFYCYHRYIKKGRQEISRDAFPDKPEKVQDDRCEADKEAPELKLEDVEDLEG